MRGQGQLLGQADGRADILGHGFQQGQVFSGKAGHTPALEEAQEDRRGLDGGHRGDKFQVRAEDNEDLPQVPAAYIPIFNKADSGCGPCRITAGWGSATPGPRKKPWSSPGSIF